MQWVCAIACDLNNCIGPRSNRVKVKDNILEHTRIL